MNKKIIAKNLLGIICIFSMSSLVVVLMPLTELIPENAGKVFGFIIGILFWISLIGGIVAYLRLYKRCRVIIQESIGKCRSPLIVFFSNPVAKVIDLILITSIIVNITFMTLVNPPAFLIWFGIFTFVTSLYLHFLLNGRIFKYIITK